MALRGNAVTPTKTTLPCRSTIWRTNSSILAFRCESSLPTREERWMVRRQTRETQRTRQIRMVRSSGTMSPMKRAKPPSVILTRCEKAARSWTSWTKRRWVSSPEISRRAPRSAAAPPAPTATSAHPTPRAPTPVRYPPPQVTDAAPHHRSREKSQGSVPHFRFCPRMTHLVYRKHEQESGER